MSDFTITIRGRDGVIFDAEIDVSDFTITIRGRDGVIFDAEIDESLRIVRRLALDDDRLKELLVVTSVVAGTVEAEILKRHLKQGGGAS